MRKKQAAPLRGLCRLALSPPVPASLRACVRVCCWLAAANHARSWWKGWGSLWEPPL